MSIARDAGVISDAQQKEIDELFTGKDGNFDEEAFAEAFARELKRAFHETVQKRMEDVPTTKAGRALRRVADFIVTLAKSFAFWRQERGLDPVTGQPLQAGQVLDAFLKRERTAVDEATRLDNLARAARAASLRATAEARDNAPTQAVVDEDGTVVAYHERGDRVSAEELERVRAEMDEVRRQYEGTEQWMKAPNGKPTRLNERQWLQVRTPSFKAWFGDWENDPANASKVVDENGEPLVVYHGSIHSFSVFGQEWKSNKFKETPTHSYMVTPSQDGAGRYGDTIGLFVNARNVADYRSKEAIREAVGRNWEEAANILRMIVPNRDFNTREDVVYFLDGATTRDGRLFQLYENPDLYSHDGDFNRVVQDIIEKDALQNRNADGYLFLDNSGGIRHDSYGLFAPQQLKSATDNVGTFNPDNVDIRWHISDSDRNTWNEGVRDYLEHAAKMDGDMYWRLEPKQMFSEAPDILKFLSRTGVLSKIFGDMFNEALPIKVDISVMDKIHQGTDARRIGAAHTHDLTDDDLYRLIDAISDPLAIAVSNVHPENSIVFFTELLERKVAWNGEEYYNPVLIPLLLKTRGSRNDRYYEITSAYGISNPNTWRGIIEQLSKYPDELLYVNKGKLSRHESPRFSQKGQRTYVAPKERGLRRLADTLQNVMSHSRNRVPDEWGFKKLAPELHKPSSPSIIDQPASETQGENKADPNEERRDHIHVWSGARQAYDRVDLRFIGSGTGGNNEGRGAYSSGVRGVAQDKYARGALGSLTYTADNIPVVYDGKSMTLKDAYGLARETAYRNDEIDEGWMIREINYQAGQLSSDNAIVGGLVDYNELREWMLEEFENESEPLTYEEVLADFSKLKALPIERRMGYDYGGGFDTRRYEGKDDKIIRSEMRDFYVDKDRFGFVHYRDVEEANRLYEEILAKMPKDSRKGNTRQKKLELLDKVLPEVPEARPAVMEQTWFTNRPEGDVSHLLNWFEAVTPEQLGWIVEGARKAGFSEKEIAFLQRERIDDDDVLIEDGNRMPSGREMYMRLEVISVFRTKKKNAAYLRMQERLRRNPFEERPTEEETKGETFDAVTTEDLRRAHRDVMGDAGKFASEFLVSADIDGMMYPVDYRHGNRDGRVSGWNYVAFSDEHLRVDHVYEYNPETDDFELKWHEGVGSGPRFTETPLGQELVARAFDAIMGSRVDLLLRPSRFYGNPYETRERNPRKALVTEHLHRDVDVSEPKGFATEVSAEISRFGTRDGDPTLRDIRARCGSKARFYEVLGAVYETAEAVRSGLAEVVTGRERAMMSNAGLQAADFIKHNATARATAAGRKLYLMGREFAWKLYQEDIASAWAEVERQRRGRGDCGMIGGKCEGKGPSRHGERRWPKARRMR